MDDQQLKMVSRLWVTATVKLKVTATTAMSKKTGKLEIGVLFHAHGHAKLRWVGIEFQFHHHTSRLVRTFPVEGEVVSSQKEACRGSSNEAGKEVLTLLPAGTRGRGMGGLERMEPAKSVEKERVIDPDGALRRKVAEGEIRVAPSSHTFGSILGGEISSAFRVASPPLLFLESFQWVTLSEFHQIFQCQNLLRYKRGLFSSCHGTLRNKNVVECVVTKNLKLDGKV